MKRARRIKIGQEININHNGDISSVSVVDISYGGIRVKSDIKPEVGGDITISHDHAGELIGKIARHTKEGFAIQLGESENSANFALQSITSDMHSDSSTDEQEE